MTTMGSMTAYTKKKHNGVISIWKFIFAILIILHHGYAIHDNGVEHTLFICGAIAVDFFFIVSGWLMSAKINAEAEINDERPIYKATKEFIFEKIKKILPFMVFSYLLIAILFLIFGGYIFKEYVQGLVDLTFLQIAGLPNTGFVGGAWYVSAMILAMLLLYPLHKKFQKTFSWLIAPMIAIFFGGYLIASVVSMRDAKVWLGLCYVGLIKAIFETAIGCIAYEVSCSLSKVKFKAAGKVFLTTVELICFVIVIFFNLFFEDRDLDWLFIILLFIGVSIAFSEQTYFYNASCNSAFYYLERLSLPMYLNNFISIKLVNSLNFLSELSWGKKLVVVVLFVILLSAIEIPLMAWITGGCKKLKKSIAGKLIDL